MSSPTIEDRLAVRSRPERGPVMHQTWKDLLFLHWTWEAEELRATLPKGLFLDTFDGRAFLGVVPFKMRRIRPRFVPAVPWISDFLELNLRTYVHDRNGQPGVWFYSLDANRRLAVSVARTFFALPYHLARMSARDRSDGFDFEWERVGAQGTGGSFRWSARGAAERAEPGTLEFFLLERYVLFARRGNRILSGRVHHEPYPFREADVPAFATGVFGLNDLVAPERPPDHAVTSDGVAVTVYGTEIVDI